MPPSPWQTLYTNHADLYAQLVAHEDVNGRLLPALQAVHPLRGAAVVEFGAGTGRVTRLLAPLAARLYAFDVTAARLRAAQAQQPPHAGSAL
ncbi:MAG: hypothetical protein KC425_02605, partial [Anaerolineales bacterium]|nr:hypothetical protein [Anaerolineales bacterium]